MPEGSIVKGLPSVGHQNLVSLTLAGIIKPFVEMGVAMTPIGNQSIVSGIVKVGGGVVIHLLGASKIPYAGDALVASLIVDGGEDLTRGIASGNIWGGAAASQASASAGW